MAVEEPSYKEFCKHCEAGDPVRWDYRAKEWHHVYADDKYPFTKELYCNASKLRELYVEYKMKVIETPVIIIPKKESTNEQ
jgi:hypothetical protein